MTGRIALDTPPNDTSADPRMPWTAAAAADVVAVVVFVAIGRRSHDESSALGGLVVTAWPFLSGALLGWLISRGWRTPGTLRPTGLAVWLACVFGGMVLRAVSGQGVAVSFVIVATIVLGAFLLGWRAVARMVVRRHSR